MEEINKRMMKICSKATWRKIYLNPSLNLMRLKCTAISLNKRSLRNLHPLKRSLMNSKHLKKLIKS